MASGFSGSVQNRENRIGTWKGKKASTKGGKASKGEWQGEGGGCRECVGKESKKRLKEGPFTVRAEREKGGDVVQTAAEGKKKGEKGAGDRGKKG